MQNKPLALTFDHDYYHGLIYRKFWYDSTRNTDIPPKITIGFWKTDNPRRSNQFKPQI